MARELARNSPSPPPFLICLDAVGHPETGHRVEDPASEADLDPLAPERSAPHALTQDGLVSGYGVLYQASPAVA
jgi:hypothetical protein